MKKRVLIYGAICLLVCTTVVTSFFVLTRGKQTQEQEAQQANFKGREANFSEIIGLVNAHRATVEKLEYPLFYLQYDKGDISLLSKDLEIVLKDSEILSLRSVSDAFPDSAGVLATISVYPGRISFDTEPKRYALVYTEDDSQPRFLFRPDETGKIRCAKIQPHWYHVFYVN